MRRWPLFALLASLWLLAPLAVVSGLSPGAPSFVVMPVVAGVAAWQAERLRDAWLLPGLVMLLPVAYVLVTGLVADGLSLALADEALWVAIIHVIPVALLAAVGWWLIHRGRGTPTPG